MKTDVLRILGILAVVGVVIALGCRPQSGAESVGMNGLAGTNSSVMPALPSGEVAGITTPILMVWRDAVSGRIKSRTLPLGAESGIELNPKSNSREAAVTTPATIALRAIVALE